MPLGICYAMSTYVLRVAKPTTRIQITKSGVVRRHSFVAEHAEFGHSSLILQCVPIGHPLLLLLRCCYASATEINGPKSRRTAVWIAMHSSVPRRSHRQVALGFTPHVTTCCREVSEGCMPGTSIGASKRIR